MQILILQLRPEEGKWCQFVAFTAVIAMICLNGSCLTIAYTMYQLVMFGPKHIWRSVIYGNLASWLVGIIIGIWYIADGALGPYRGLYCCIRGEAYNGARIFLIFGSFVLSIAVQSILYGSAFYHIRKTESAAKNSIQPVTGPSAPSGDDQDDDQVAIKLRPSTSVVFMKKGIQLVSIFYVCWFWISVDALIVFSGKEVPLASSIVGAIFAKSNSVIHCLVMTSHIEKARQKVVVLHKV